MSDFDVIVIGGGMAGISVAYELAATHRVVVTEAEAQLAAHSTGRSAAILIPSYGSETARPLTVASQAFLLDPPPGFTDMPFMSNRGALWIARPDQATSLEPVAAAAEEAGTQAIPLSAEEAVEMVPVLRPDRLHGALWEPDALDMDVAAIHQSYVRGLRQRKGEVVTSAPVSRIQRQGSAWVVEAGDHELTASILVNATGAWGDVIARLAGVTPVGLQPMRRTAFMVGGKDEWVKWPMVIDADHEFYFKPDGPQLLCSPADETPTDPGDARPDPLDVALAIERINEATTLEIRSVRSEWAGLRTFAPDRSLVIGPDPEVPEFVWMVGQGGTGIQAAPATAQLTAALVRGEGMPGHIAEAGLDLSAVSPDRPSLSSGE